MKVGGLQRPIYLFIYLMVCFKGKKLSLIICFNYILEKHRIVSLFKLGNLVGNCRKWEHSSNLCFPFRLGIVGPCVRN